MNFVARLRESFDVRVARRDHQVAVEGLVDMRAQRRDHLRPEGDVGREMSIHHVEVDPIGAGRGDVAHFLAELGEVADRIEGAMTTDALIFRLLARVRFEERAGRAPPV